MPASLSPSQYKELLKVMIRANEPVLATGAPGIGKTDIMHEACDEVGADLIVIHPAISDPTKVEGMPWPDAKTKTANFLPFGDFKRCLEATKPTVLFMDDLGQASPAMQAACMQIIHAASNSRRIGDHVLPKCVTPMAATNLRTHRAGVQGMLEPVKSRFTTIVEVHTNVDDSAAWFIDHGYPPWLPTFLHFRPELLHGWNVFCEKCNKYVVVGVAGQCPTCKAKLQSGPSNDMVNSPNPRTWANAGRISRLGLPAIVELAAMQGAVGEGAAAEALGFIRIERELPSLDSILLDPDSAAIPTRPEARYAVAVGVAQKANAGNFARVAQYAERLRKANASEFAALMIRDSYRRNKDICDTPAFIKMMAGELGKLVRGE